jgi:predicted transcriptional regulator
MVSSKDRTEIAGQILEAVYDHSEDGIGVTQTKIGYTVYLNNGSLRDYLSSLTIHGLLAYDLAMRRYHITERDIRFLELYSKLGDMI